MSPPDMSGIERNRRVLGFDLAGVTGATGYAVLETQGAQAKLVDAGVVSTSGTPVEGEDRLLELVDRIGPDVLAVDAPLTLPPCLTCPSYCRGPGQDCELAAARRMWESGSNPVIRRPCELEAKNRIPGLDPKPTMGLGIITARAVSLVRKLESRGVPPSSIVRGEVLEIYPAASLRRMGWTERPPQNAEPSVKSEFFAQVAASLQSEIEGLDDHPQCIEVDDVFDALIAAYTGWLYPDRLETPPPGFNLASGWIWAPAEQRAQVGA